MSTNILVVGPAWVGDMVMAQSLFKALKQREPETEIDVLAPDWSFPVLERMPEIRRTIVSPTVHGKLGFKERFKLGRKLLIYNYQQAIILTGSWKSALIPFWAKIPRRTGWLGECRWGLLNDVRKLDKKLLPKLVQRYVALAYEPGIHVPELLPRPELVVSKTNLASTLDKFSLQQNNKILGLCPGAAYGATKRWPESYFAEVAREKINAGWDVWFFGSHLDSAVIQRISSKVDSRVYNFAGKINLFETIDLLSVVDVIVTNDSGLMHIAASLNKPLVAIYGSTSSEFTPPLGSEARVISSQLDCSPCFKRECPLGHHDCMRSILPEKILWNLNEIESG